jgi:uncharacterized protein YndB with AHSA1/START domain
VSTISRTVRTDASPQQVFDYLVDFTRTEEWDPGTVTTERVSGDGGVGTRYHNVSRFLGRETELEYTVIDLEAGSLVRLRGVNDTVTATDTMRITPDGTGSVVEYTAEFEWKGVAKVAGPLLAPALKRLGDEAEQGLQENLGRLARG